MSVPANSSEIPEPRERDPRDDASVSVVPSGASESEGSANAQSAITVPIGSSESSGYASVSPSHKPKTGRGRRIFQMVACSTEVELLSNAGKVRTPVNDEKEAEGEGHARAPEAEVVRITARVSRVPSEGPQQKPVKVRAFYGPLREHSVAVSSVGGLE